MVALSLVIGFWDEQNWKIIRSKDVIFNEQVFYKDRLGKVLDKANSEVRMPEAVNLKDFSMNDLQVNVHKVQETTLLEDQENVAL